VTAWVDIREAIQKTTAELLRIAMGRLSPGANSDDASHALCVPKSFQPQCGAIRKPRAPALGTRTTTERFEP
jgi:hypothetical protein